MSEHILISRSEANSALALHFERSPSHKSVLAVREDKCFKEQEWLNLGTISLNPGVPEPGEELRDRLLASVSLGFFEWECPPFQEAAQKLIELMAVHKEEQISRAQRALDAVGCVAARVGLVHPLFDADAIAQMPFRRPTTVVPDTSAILQGGLDFVVRFLYPMARLKVPAIAHMEILNSADNYFKCRRSAKLKDPSKALFEHAVSQGGQRALLRLELQTDAEIERGRLGADPLRGVIQSDSDAEDSNLGLQKVQRSFADRLIFETARQHLSQSSPDHPVILMTADQGLARMTLGEGMQPIFFEATSFQTVSGRRLSGTTYDPFTGRVYPISLADLLWEFAVTFGMARLATPDESSSIEVCAMGDDLTWKPYHAKDDLLWVRSAAKPSTAQQTILPRQAAAQTEAPPVGLATAGTEPVTTKVEVPSGRAKAYAGSYKFSVPKMIALIDRLASEGRLRQDEALGVLSIKSPVQFEDYRNFLLAGGLIESGEHISATPALRDLLSALKTLDHASATALFKRVPSFTAFSDYLLENRPDNPVAQRALPTYTALAEVLGIGFEIPDERVYGTPDHPTLEEFADLALSTYEKIGGTSEQYVLTGLWLEGLVRDAKVHPITSRALLEQVRERGLLDRFTEGSTPETRYQNHTLNLLDLQHGHPIVRKIGIFEGDFLLPGKSSVSIRLKRGQA